MSHPLLIPYTNRETCFIELLLTQNVNRMVFLPAQGTTRTGDLITIAQVGTLDTAEWIRSMTDAEYFEFNLHILEFQLYTCDVESVRTRKLVRATTIFDCRGSAFRQLSSKSDGKQTRSE